MEPIINSQIPEFKVQAFHNGEFKTVTNKDIEGKWAIFFFYPADFTFVCPTELVDMAEKYDRFKEMGVEVYSVSTDSHLFIKHGMMLPKAFAKSLIQCWQILPELFLAHSV